MKDKDNKPKKGLKIALYVSLVLFLISSFLLIYIYFFTGAFKVLGDFEVADIDPVLANKLTGNIVYSVDQLEESIYFSEVLQATIEVDQNIFNVFDSPPDRVTFNPKGGETLFLFSSARLRIIETDVKEFSQQNLFYDDLELLSEQEVDGIGYLLYSYSLFPSISERLSMDLGEIQQFASYITVIYMDLEDGRTAYLEVIGLNYERNIALTENFINVLKTLNFDIDDIDQEIEVKMGNGDVEISIDRGIWSLSNLKDNSISILGKVEFDNIFSVNSFPAIGFSKGDDVQSYLSIQAEEKLTSTQEYIETTDHTFSKVGETVVVEIDGVLFVKMSYEVAYSTGGVNTHIFYYGLLEEKGNLITISFRTSDDNEENLSLLEDLIESMRLYDEEINSMVLGTSSVSINPTTILGQSSTVKIFVSKCNNISFSNNLPGWYVNGKSYKVCGAGTGSGFVIDDNGHIVTNAHVADPNSFDLLITGASTDGSFEEDIVKDVLDILYEQYGPMVATLPQEQILLGVIEVLYTMNEQGLITMNPEAPTLYIQGTQPFLFSEYSFDLQNPSFHHSASLVKSNEITSSIQTLFDSDVKAADVPDLALIKVNTDFLIPSIPVRGQGIVPGQQIFAIGYPGIAENSQLSSATSVTPSTVTQGAISAIRPNSNNTYEIIQIDASLDGGNSGGPIISDDGYVVGVATYGIRGSDSGNYNVGIKADSVETFLASAGVTLSLNQEREVLEEALSDISNSYYSAAYEKLLGLVVSEPSLATVLDPFIELCDVKIQAGEDRTPIVDPSLAATVIIIILSTILFVMVIILVLLIVTKKKGESDNIPQQPNYNYS